MERVVGGLIQEAWELEVVKEVLDGGAMRWLLSRFGRREAVRSAVKCVGVACDMLEKSVVDGRGVWKGA